MDDNGVIQIDSIRRHSQVPSILINGLSQRDKIRDATGTLSRTRSIYDTVQSVRAQSIYDTSNIIKRQSIYVFSTISLATRYHNISGKAFIQTERYKHGMMVG